MPGALLRPCAVVGGGCPTLVVSGCCKKHARQEEQWRGSASARGYGWRWAKYRRWFIAQCPLCGDRLPGAPETTDSVCRLEGRTVATEVVDHIVPVTGPDDPSFFDPLAHQGLCEHCHSLKRQRERRS